MLWTRFRKLSILSSIIVASIIASLVVGPWLKPASQSQPAPPEIRVTYSWSYTNTIAGGGEPSEGLTFLIISLTMENRGYPSFTADPFKEMFVLAGSRSYNVSALFIFLQNPFPRATIPDGGQKSGDVLFEVPQGTSSFEPMWRQLKIDEFRIIFLPRQN
jgi:hypothetical protein